MSRFIELNFSNNNQPVLINTASIMCVSANGTGTNGTGANANGANGTTNGAGG